MLWLGVDVGGTFTDLVLFDVTAGTLKVLKTPSTPHNQADGIQPALRAWEWTAASLSASCMAPRSPPTPRSRATARSRRIADGRPQGCTGRRPRQPHGDV